ncbi:MAG: dynamin family protein [Thermodesulfobacteriota bacterium]
MKTEPPLKETARFELAESAVSDLGEILARMKDIPGMHDESFEKWESAVREIPERIRSGLIRVAVAGAIKSGKSTLINSMAGGDFLKRGAGVATSIVTRIQKHDKLSARIVLKSFDEINSQVEQALNLISGAGFDKETRFDIRRKKDRQYLSEVNEKCLSDLSIEDSAVRTEKLIMENALAGYAECRDIVESDEAVLELSGDEFSGHKRFTGDPALAFFVRDVKLYIHGVLIDEGVEVADCQGADSTDPAHLSQILKYLESANMIVYVISSRTGIREADVKFLSLVREMGLIENILFVINCDLSEHDGLDDFLMLEQKIRHDLSFVKKDVEVYSFSSLFNLFEKTEENLSARDADRLAQWRRDAEFTDYAARMTNEFNRALGHMIEHDRYHLLLFNHVERLNLIAENVKERLDLFSDILGDDAEKAEQTVAGLKETREKSIRMELIFRSSARSMIKGLKEEIESDLDFHFNKSEDAPARSITGFVEGWSPDRAPYLEKIASRGFSEALHLFFLDFAKAFNRYAVEKITPKIMKLVRNQEEKIRNHFKALYDSYTVVPPGYAAFGREGMSDAEPGMVNVKESDTSLKSPVDLEMVKKIAGLEIPDLRFSPGYTGRIRVESLAGFGFHSVVQVLRKLLNREETLSMERGFKTACARMKKEVLADSLKGMAEYESELKNQYLYPLIESSLRSFDEVMSEKFRAGGMEIEKAEALVREEQSEKSGQKELVDTLGSQVDGLLSKIDRII